jgi:hypothetical protein
MLRCSVVLVAWLTPKHSHKVLVQRAAPAWSRVTSSPAWCRPIEELRPGGSTTSLNIAGVHVRGSRLGMLLDNGETCSGAVVAGALRLGADWGGRAPASPLLHQGDEGYTRCRTLGSALPIAGHEARPGQGPARPGACDEGTPTRVSGAAQMALAMLASITRTGLGVRTSLLVEGRGRGASSTAQTTLPPSAVGRTPNARDRPATMVSPRPCRPGMKTADPAGRDRGLERSGAAPQGSRRRTGVCLCRH